MVYAVQDDLVKNTLKNIDIKKPKANLNYNYQNIEIIPIKLSILTPIKSEKKVYEGQSIEFKSVDDVIYNDKIILKKDEKVTARIETIIKNGMNGIPASVVLGNFKAENLDENNFQYDYEKYGLDLSLLVFPLKWALTFLPPTGSLTNFIKGGHVSFKKNKIITVNYYIEK